MDAEQRCKNAGKMLPRGKRVRDTDAERERERKRGIDRVKGRSKGSESCMS
jgi:hypothetical protein